MLVVIKNVHAIRKLHNTGLDISIHVIHFSQLAIQGELSTLKHTRSTLSITFARKSPNGNLIFL